VIKKSNSINVIRITKSYCSHVRLIIKLKLGLIISYFLKRNAKAQLLFRFYHTYLVIRIETIHQ